MGLGSLSLRRNSESSSSGQSALQKALERNRKKQLKRQALAGGSSSSSSSIRGGSSLSNLRSRTTLSASSSSTNNSSLRSSLRSRLSGRTPDSLSASRVGGVSTTRKTVARGNDDVGFTTPLKKTTRSSPAVSYSRTTRKTTRTTTRKATPLSNESWYVRYGVYLGWAFAGLLFVRLIFAERGVVDYYKKQDLINAKIAQQTALKKENKALLTEIDRLDNDQSFQKKTVRKHLGVIARDEFLVLFAREVGTSKSASFQP